MRLDIPIDEDLMLKAMQATGLKNQALIIEKALRLLVQTKTTSSDNLMVQLLDNPLEPVSDPTPFSRTEIYGGR